MIVVFHENCVDGFTAAWAAWKKYPDAKFIPAKYGDEPPDVTGEDMLIVDFSYKRDVLIAMSNEAKSLTLFDHHLTAEEDLRPLVKELANIREIPLSDGTVAYIDADDVALVSDYAWSRAKHGGAIAYLGGGRANATMGYMHRLIMCMPGDEFGIDHRNRDTVDNRKSNLRPATKQQNAANMDRGSETRGVSKRADNRWIAQITVDGKNTYLGTFKTQELAGAAYDSAAREAFGEFARTNSGLVQPVSPKAKIVFDMERSGAGIAWDYLHPDAKRPNLISYVEDRDLWRFVLPDSKAINAYIGSQEQTFENWDRIAKMTYEEILPLGRAAQAVVDSYVRAMVEHARVSLTFACPVVNVPPMMASEVLHALAKPVALGWFQRADGLYQYSLRSVGGFDVSEIAKCYGGGGHKNAAGFTSATRVDVA